MKRVLRWGLEFALLMGLVAAMPSCKKEKTGEEEKPVVTPGEERDEWKDVPQNGDMVMLYLKKANKPIALPSPKRQQVKVAVIGPNAENAVLGFDAEVMWCEIAKGAMEDTREGKAQIFTLRIHESQDVFPREGHVAINGSVPVTMTQPGASIADCRNQLGFFSPANLGAGSELAEIPTKWNIEKWWIKHITDNTFGELFSWEASYETWTMPKGQGRYKWDVDLYIPTKEELADFFTALTYKPKGQGVIRKVGKGKWNTAIRYEIVEPQDAAGNGYPRTGLKITARYLGEAAPTEAELQREDYWALNNGSDVVRYFPYLGNKQSATGKPDMRGASVEMWSSTPEGPNVSWKAYCYGMYDATEAYIKMSGFYHNFHLSIRPIARAK